MDFLPLSFTRQFLGVIPNCRNLDKFQGIAWLYGEKTSIMAALVEEAGVVMVVKVVVKVVAKVMVVVVITLWTEAKDLRLRI